MTSGKLVYVAETDDSGQIACVWYTESGAKAPRPVTTPTRHLALLGGAQCHGASAQDIGGWLTRQAGQHPLA